MAQRIIERACDRFRKEISSQNAKEIVSTGSIDDVKLALGQVERHLAARQYLRNFDRMAPFLGAAERLSQVVEVVCNGTPYLPWIWAPVKLIIQSARDHSHVMDKLLMAYGKIGTHMPRLSKYAEAFPDDEALQQMIAYLFEDVLEFHRKAFSMIQKPGWTIFFSSAWGQFEHRFSSLLDNIEQLGEQIDREAAALDIIKATEQRSKTAEDTSEREKRWQTAQFEATMNWLGIEDDTQEAKLEMISRKYHEGTCQWILKTTKMRTWLQTKRGNPVLWLNGKPGSGKSILSSMLVRFLRSDPNRRVCFFFCDYNTSPIEIGTQIMRTICAQILRLAPDLVSYVYDECLGKAQRPSSDVLKKLLPQLISRFDHIQVIIDGIDEVSTSEHRYLIKNLLLLSDAGLRLLLVSQDLPSISTQLSKRPKLCLNEEGEAIRKDHAIVVEASLQELNADQNGAIPDEVMRKLKKDILDKSEGMFLWVSLVMALLRMSANMHELQHQIFSLPRSLADVYQKLLNNICHQASASSIAKIKKIFAWLKCHKGRQPMLKREIRLGMVLDETTERMTRQTRPFTNATDICKPLIEDGPGNTLVFVHSTVPQFLFASEPESIMSVPESIASVTFACICQLNQVLDLLHSPNPTSEFTIEVACGLYGLLPYSHQFWTQHLLEFLSSSEQVATSLCATVLKGLEQLCQKLIKLSRIEEVSLGTDETSVLLQKYLHETEAAVIAQIIKQEKQSVSQEQWTVHAHSATLQKYHNTVRHVVRQSSVIGVMEDELKAFKEEYGPTAFICDWPNCDRILRGFPSEGQLSSHQARHSQKLRCYNKDCLYNDVGFATERSLKSHRKRMHPDSNSSTEPIPKRLRETPTEAAASFLPGLDVDTVGIPSSLPQGVQSRESSDPMTSQAQRPGMPGQQHVGTSQNAGQSARAQSAIQLLLSHDIEPRLLTPEQFQNFANQPPDAQKNSIANFSQNLQQHHGQQMPNKGMPNPGPQGQGSPMIQPNPAEISNLFMAREDPNGPRPVGPGTRQGGGGNNVLQDYRMQLLLQEQQRQTVEARAKQDSVGRIPRGLT